MPQPSQTILVSIRYAGAKTPCCIGPSADATLASIRSVALYSFGISEDAGEDYKFFSGSVELVDLTETVGHLAAGEPLLRLDLGTMPNAAEWDPQFELTPNQIERIMRIEADAAEFRRQMQRVGVDMSIAQLIGKLDESATTRISTEDVAVVETYYAIDRAKESAAMGALQQLPDGAGNAAFLAVYNDRTKE